MKGDVFGQKGDFITAPEISQVFGEVGVATRVRELLCTHCMMYATLATYSSWWCCSEENQASHSALDYIMA